MAESLPRSGVLDSNSSKSGTNGCGRAESSSDEEIDEIGGGNLFAVVTPWLDEIEDFADYTFYADHKSTFFHCPVEKLTMAMEKDETSDSQACTLLIKQDPIMRSRVNKTDKRLTESERDSATGAVVWNTSVVLGQFLVHNAASFNLAGASGIELGSGLGLGGLLLLLAGCGSVTLTDRGEILPLLTHNVTANKAQFLDSQSAQVISLQWGELTSKEMGPFDIVIAADCVYDRGIVDPLLATLKAISTVRTKIYVGWDTAIGFYDVYKFFCTRATKDFLLELVPRDKLHPKYNKATVALYKLTRRPQSALQLTF